MQQTDQFSKTAKTGLFWSLISRFGTLFITFLSNLILVRLLSPQDFGTVGILLVFIAVATTLLDGGLGTALIQKSNPTKDDYSTVFTFNIFISIFLYSVLFCSAPYIANFYNISIITSILRTQGLVLIINAFRIIQYNLIIKKLEFKKLAIVDITSATIGSLCGIIMAKSGLGIWSLVFNNLLYSLVFTIIVNICGNWHPKLQFEISNFRQLFSFGGMIMLSNILDSIYKNIQHAIIGKMFNTATVGYYSQAKKLEEIPVLGITSAVNSVFFPIFSLMQNDKQKICDALCKSTSIISYLLFPIMILVIFIAKPLIEIIYTSKWDESISLFQLLCIAGMIMPITMLNLNVIKSRGKGKLFLFLQITQITIGLTSMIVGAHWGIKGLIGGYIITSYMFTIILVCINSIQIDKRCLYQLIEIVKNFILASTTGLITYIICNTTSTYSSNNILLVFNTTIVYIAVYILISALSRSSSFKKCVDIALKKSR